MNTLLLKLLPLTLILGNGAFLGKTLSEMSFILDKSIAAENFT